MSTSLESSAKLGLALFLVTAVVMSGLAFAQSGGDDPLAGQPTTGTPHEIDRAGVRGTIVDALADILGLDRAELAAALTSAGTVAAAAEASGVAAADVAAALEAVAFDHIERADAAGFIDATEKTYQRVSDRIAEFLVTDVTDLLVGRRTLARERFAALLGMTVDDVRLALDSGETLGGLIEATGRDVDGFVAELVAPLQERADQAVADGLLDPETAADHMDAVVDRIIDRIAGSGPIDRPGDSVSDVRRSDLVFDAAN